MKALYGVAVRDCVVDLRFIITAKENKTPYVQPCFLAEKCYLQLYLFLMYLVCGMLGFLLLFWSHLARTAYT